jgi:hypothetical protein
MLLSGRFLSGSLPYIKQSSRIERRMAALALLARNHFHALAVALHLRQYSMSADRAMNVPFRSFNTWSLYNRTLDNRSYHMLLLYTPKDAIRGQLVIAI